MNRFSTLIIILLFVAFLLRIDFIFYVIYVCLGVYLWSRWATSRSMKNLESRRIYQDHAFWGESVPVSIELINKGRLSLPWVRIVESVPANLRVGRTINEVVPLGRKKKAVFTYHVAARRRGYYQIGPMRLTTGDIFGIQPEVTGTLPAQYLTIYPRLTPLTKLGLPSRLPFGTIASRQRLFEDPARPMGVRDFRSGDSIRQINWKTSAHTRNLVVKTFTPAISLETAVMLDLHNEAYQPKNRLNRQEWAIEVSASLAAHLVEQRQAVGLITNGIDPLSVGEGPEFDENTGRLLRHSAAAISDAPYAFLPPPIPPRNGRYHLIKILERLARIEPDQTIPLAAWADQAASNLSWGVTILVVTARGSEIVCQTLHRLVRAGYNPVLIAVEPDGNFNKVVERSRRLGFAAYNVAHTADLNLWRQPKKRTM